jgi:hypothetical protein
MRSKFNETDELSKQKKTGKQYMAVKKINDINHRQLDVKIKMEF